MSHHSALDLSEMLANIVLARPILCWLLPWAAYGPNPDGPGLQDFIRKSADLAAFSIAVNTEAA